MAPPTRRRKKRREEENDEDLWPALRGWTTKLSRTTPLKKTLFAALGLFVCFVFFAIFTMNPDDMRALKLAK